MRHYEVQGVDMSKLLLSVLGMAILFTGCSYPVEVTKRLALFESTPCERPKRMPIGEAIVIGDDVEFKLTKGMFGDNTLVVLPFKQDRVNFKEEVYLYTKGELSEFIKCYQLEVANNKKNIAVIKDSNLKAPKK